MNEQQSQSIPGDADRKRRPSAETQNETADPLAERGLAEGVVDPRTALPNNSMTRTLRQNAVLRMQQTQGNAAVRRMLYRQSSPSETVPAKADTVDTTNSEDTLQRSIGSVIADGVEAGLNAGRHALNIVPNPMDPLGSIFEAVVLSNIAVSSSIPIPPNYRSKLLEYAQDNPGDGLLLLPAIARMPTFHSGGWVLSTQDRAGAMTLDTDIFVKGNLDIGTYIHELVHVTQYGLLGRTGFLVSYFGLSAATIAARWVMGQPIDVMESSPHESQAYALEQRFLAWYATHP